MFASISANSGKFAHDDPRPISTIIIGTSDGTKRFKVEQATADGIRLEGLPKTQRIKLVVGREHVKPDIRNEQIIDNRKPSAPTENKDQKKVMHREIERKRRDRINDWIQTLSNKVPSCRDDHTKQGQSKSGVLAKTATYIDEMREELSKLQNISDELFTAKAELHELRLRCMHLETENEKQKEALERNKIKIE